MGATPPIQPSTAGSLGGVRSGSHRRVDRKTPALGRRLWATLTNSTQYDFSWTNMFTCILKVWFCQTTTINQFSFTSCKHTDRKSTSSHLEAKFLFISLSHLLCHMSEVEVGTWRQKPQQRITKTWRKDQCHKRAVGRYSLVTVSVSNPNQLTTNRVRKLSRCLAK